eukprot:3347409-Amphidinium_carterae.1
MKAAASTMPRGQRRRYDRVNLRLDEMRNEMILQTACLSRATQSIDVIVNVVLLDDARHHVAIYCRSPTCSQRCCASSHC